MFAQLIPCIICAYPSSFSTYYSSQVSNHTHYTLSLLLLSLISLHILHQSLLLVFVIIKLSPCSFCPMIFCQCLLFACPEWEQSKESTRFTSIQSVPDDHTKQFLPIPPPAEVALPPKQYSRHKRSNDQCVQFPSWRTSEQRTRRAPSRIKL